MVIRQFIDQGAIFSADRKHRFRLFFEWDETRRRMALVMLNPSKADADPESPYCFDPTLRSVLRLAENNGFGGVDIVNVYSVICTDPRELPQHGLDLVREETRRHFQQATRGGGVVVGWGRNWKGWQDDRAWLRDELAGRELWCFGKNQDGSPVHPLYLPAATPLEPWGWP